MKSIKAKLIISLTVGIILVLGFVIFNNYKISKITEKNNIVVLNNISSLSNEYISYRVQKSNDIAIVLSNNSHLNAITRNFKIGESISNTEINALAKDIMYQGELNEEVESIYAYLKNEKIFIDSYGNRQFNVELEDIEWLFKYAKGDSSVRWVETKDTRYDDLSLISIIYRSDKFNSNVSSPVYLSINYNPDEFYKLIGRAKLAEQTAIALVNFDDDLFICDSDVLTKIDIRQVVYKNKEYLKNNSQMRVNIEGLGEGNLIYSQLEAFDGAIIHIVPDQFTEVISSSERALLLILGAIILIGYIILMMMFVKNNIDKPIEKLLVNMEKTGKGQFSEMIKDNRTDEFGQLFIAYNEMVNEVDNLIQKLYQEQLVKSELELKVLQEKINPHFLYNTLDTINWIAKEHKVQEISNLVLNLSEMYRMTFNKGNDLISINDMLVGIGCYLQIQKMRYGDSFTYELVVDDELKEYEILNLIVQTLVENSIVHGMSDLNENGRVTIKCHRKFSNINVTVFDNGIGMNEEKLKLIRANINSSMLSTESGLSNVQKRIKLYYGIQYGLKIDSTLGKGTSIEIVIPYKGEKHD